MRIRSAIRSDDRDFDVTTEHRAERGHHLAERRVDADGVDQRRHQVDLGVGGVGARARRSAASTAAWSRAGGPASSRLQLARFVLVGDLQQRDLVLVVALGEGVDADDDATAGVEAPLELVGGVGDLALEPVVLDARDRTLEHRAVAELVEVGEQLLGLSLDLVGERLDVPRPAERIGDVGDVGLVGDHLLGAQRDARRLLGRQRHALRPSSWCAATACRRARRRAPRSRCGRC